MKRMVDEEIIKSLQEIDLTELSALLSKMSINDYDELVISPLTRFENGFSIPNLSYLVNNEDEELVPLENNAGKVLVVNEDEDGLAVAEKGTKLYKHTLNAISGYTFVLISTSSASLVGLKTAGGTLYNALGNVVAICDSYFTNAGSNASMFLTPSKFSIVTFTHSSFDKDAPKFDEVTLATTSVSNITSDTVTEL